MPEGSMILVSVHGQDFPGISASLMDVLSASEAEVHDVEQIVVRGRLTLNVLVEVNQEKHTIRELLLFGWQNELHIEFEPVDSTPTTYQSLTAVTMLAEHISPSDFGAVARAITDAGGNIERIFRLSRYPTVSYEFLVATDDLDRLRFLLVRLASRHHFDLAIQEDGLARRSRQLVVLDVDSTLIQQEIIDLLAIEAGVGDEVAAITDAAMNGEIDFPDAMRSRVEMLKGLDEAAMSRVAQSIQTTPGARTFIRTLKRMGMRTAIVSAGFTRFTDPLANELGVDYSLSNTLDIKAGMLTGRVAGEVVDGPRKAEFLRELAVAEGISTAQVVAVGDGANDLDMLSEAGLGIAFNAKPAVNDNADTSVSVPYLDAILFLMGIRREHVEAADADDPDFAQRPLIEVPGAPIA